MTSKYEVKLQREFPEANEKILKTYKCALFLDVHHVGRLFTTKNNLYFLSRKNLAPPLPDVLAIQSEWKDLTAVEKSGIDGIVIKTSEEEILLDSFASRNETFAFVFTLFATAKGIKIDRPLNDDGVAESLHDHCARLMKAPIDVLPFVEDLPFLSNSYSVFDGEEQIFNASQIADHYERLNEFIRAAIRITKTAPSPRFEQALKNYVGSASESRMRLSQSIHLPQTLTQTLKENFDDHSPLLKLIVACIHPITAAIVRVKEALTSHYPTKDAGWRVQIKREADDVRVTHSRMEVAPDNRFCVEWTLDLLFDSNVSVLRTANCFVVDLTFDKETKERTRFKIQELLQALLRREVDGTVVFPSFVDVSAKQLKELPEKVIANRGTLTLYAHFNVLTSLPNQLASWNLLQVLFLDENRLQEVPEVVFELVTLRELHLGRNRLAHIPEKIAALQNLRELSVSYNMLKDLPASIGSIASLRKLYIHNNYITALPHEFAQLRLKTMQAHNNKFRVEFEMMDGPQVIFSKLGLTQ